MATTGPASRDATAALYADQRKQQLLETLRRDGRIDAARIASELGVTGETIRKDLILLERQGLLRRVHGGAVRVIRGAVPWRAGRLSAPRDRGR